MDKVIDRLGFESPLVDRLERIRLLGYARESLREIETYILSINDGQAPIRLAAEIETVKLLLNFYRSIEQRGTPPTEAAR